MPLYSSYIINWIVSSIRYSPWRLTKSLVQLVFCWAWQKNFLNSQGSKDHLWYLRPLWQLHVCDKPHLLTIGWRENFSKISPTVSKSDAMVVVGLDSCLVILAGFLLARRSCNYNFGALLLAKRLIAVQGWSLWWVKVSTRQENTVGFSGCCQDFFSLPWLSPHPKVVPVITMNVYVLPQLAISFIDLE